MTQGSNYWQRRVSRRAMIRGAGVGIAGLAGAALIGCGGDDDDEVTTAATTAPTAAPSGGAAATATAAPAEVVSAIKRGGTLLPAVRSDPTELDPHRGRGGGDHKYFWTIFDGLVQYNPAGIPDPAYSLSESWEIVDATTINLTLRKGVKFHDGTPFNAEAAKFNLDRVVNPDTESAARGQILVVTEAEVVDDNHLVLHLGRPNGALLTLLGDRGGQMVSPTAVEKLGNEGHDKNPVGTGAYKFAEWVEDSKVRVESNPDYWRKTADGEQVGFTDAIEWQIIPDATVQIASLETGDVDIVDGGAALAEIDRFEASEDIQVASFLGGGWSGMYFNPTMAPTDDVNFRRAISYAIDRNGENQALYFGRNQVVEKGMGIITPALAWAYAPVPDAPYFDLDKAREFLAQSAYPEGAKFTALINTSSAGAARGALWQDMLKQINIEMELVPTRTLTASMWVAQEFNSVLAGFSLRADPDGTVGEVVHSQGFYNAGHLPNDELDEAIEKARESYDLEERAGHYREVERLLVDNVYNVFSMFSTRYRLVHKRVQNIETIFGAEGKERYTELWLDG